MFTWLNLTFTQSTRLSIRGIVLRYTTQIRQLVVSSNIVSWGGPPHLLCSLPVFNSSLTWLQLSNSVAALASSRHLSLGHVAFHSHGQKELPFPSVSFCQQKSFTGNPLIFISYQSLPLEETRMQHLLRYLHYRVPRTKHYTIQTSNTGFAMQPYDANCQSSHKIRTYTGISASHQTVTHMLFTQHYGLRFRVSIRILQKRCPVVTSTYTVTDQHCCHRGE